MVDERKPKDPRNSLLHKYNPLSRPFFCWLDTLIFKGFRRGLIEEDLYAHPSEADSKYLLDKFNRYWSNDLQRARSLKLWLAIAKCLWWRICLHGLLSSIMVALLVCQSLLLGYLTEYFTIFNPSSTDTQNAYLIAMGLILITFLLVFFNGMNAFTGFKLGMLTRIIVSSAIYQKILKLSQSMVGQLTIGHIVNLASNDVHRFDMSLLFYHFIWIAPIHLIVSTYFIYVEIGLAALLGAFLVVLQIPLQYVLGRLFIRLRLKAAKITDKRVMVMNEIITGMRVIKMYGWEYALHQLVTNIRKTEVRAILKGAVIRSINLTYFAVSLPTIMFAIFTVYVYADPNNELSPRKVFTTFSLLVSVRLISLTFMLKSIIQLAEGRVALKRISNFLMLDELGMKQDCLATDLKTELEYANETDSKIELKDINSGEVGISVTDMSASWTPNSNTLTDISFTVDNDKPLLAVVGAVGSGKSTLLQCLLKELPVSRGDVIVNGFVAYSSQEPWVFSSTFRENILFGLPYDVDWYNTVIDVCSLDKDIDILPDGDLTVVGERGVTLSGGQKARVSLARAVYSRADIYLLDDPLSAVDAAVSRHIFDKCIRGLLSTKCVVLATHQIQYLQQCDQVLVLDKGSVSVYGDPNELLQSDRKIFEHIEKEDDDGGDDQINEFAIRRQSLGYAEELPQLDSVPSQLATVDEEGIDEDEMLLQFDNANDNLPNSKSLTFLDNEHLQNVDSFLDDATSVYSAPPLPSPSYDRVDSEPETKQPVAVKPLEAKVLSKEEQAQGTISLRTYFQYFVAGGGYIFTIFVFFLFVVTQVNIVVVDWWISDWADCDQETINVTHLSCNLSNSERVGIYFGLVTTLWITGLSRSFLFYMLLLRSARVLHNRMFNSVLRAPILFFDTNPIGRILNRFSKDTGFIDDILIFTFCEFLQLIFRFFGIMITGAIANPYIIIIVVILCVLFIGLRWYYLNCARDIKRLEALSRSPLYSHISMTLQGLCTIRSFRMQNVAMNLFHQFHNRHTQAWYLYISTTRWFGLRIDAISSLFVAAVAFISIPLSETLSPGLVGLALTYALSLNGMFQYCVRQSAEVESLMISAERVIAYGKLEPEASLETVPPTQKPPKDWPFDGQIELADVSYRHSTEAPLVLRNVTCTINAREKIGIVGRTGAGKSSLIAAIFRLAEPGGSIKIDGIECLSLGLHDLRSNISIIPQDPVLFSGTIRYNLDPFNCYTDSDIWKALEQVQLKRVVENLEGGLEASVSESGGNFSVGEKQLFCLGRALLRQNIILILDEATANVDLETDAVIQQVIREQFAHCTVLTIAHRLDTVMDSDKIMVLRFGKLAEFGEPHELLSQANSYLLRLVDHTGPLAAQKLKNMALQSHNARK